MINCPILYQQIIFFFFMAMTSIVSSQVICPPAEVIKSCTCVDRGLGDGTIHLSCHATRLSDEQMKPILDAFLSPNVNPLSRADLEDNNLVEVPYQLKMFTQLNYLQLFSNRLTSIPSGAFNFTSKLQTLFLFNNSPLASIEPGAFHGERAIFYLISKSLSKMLIF